VTTKKGSPSFIGFLVGGYGVLAAVLDARH